VNNENVTSEFPKVGDSGPPVENISGSVKTVNNYVRPAQPRGAGGRFSPRQNRIIGPLGPPGGVGNGGVDVTTGRFIPGVADHAQLHDLERVHSVTASPYYEVPDWSGGVHPMRKSHAGSADVQALANHAMSCPCLTTGGACCG
jgi:hypothetical protein